MPAMATHGWNTPSLIWPGTQSGPSASVLSAARRLATDCHRGPMGSRQGLGVVHPFRPRGAMAGGRMSNKMTIRELRALVCRDCGARQGELHKVEFCSQERCARCGGQRISCDCDDDPVMQLPRLP